MFKKRLPTPLHNSERELSAWALGELAQWFTIAREVPGRHCGGRTVRIDAVLRPRDRNLWHDPDIAFGVEFKLACRHSWDTREYTAWAAQMVDYTHVDWAGYGRLPILACPSLVEPFSTGEGGIGRAQLLAHLLGQFRVGELTRTEQEGWSILMHDTHVMWSQARGVREGRRWGLRPPVGNR
ncbi:hypothetical protein [Micromonospora psammae]|uniref:hypothetical protein n=1 Tax=Micromonospora sp. CPCC 205556 TaxID=3122398 RepID=UPI002FEF7211